MRKLGIFVIGAVVAALMAQAAVAAPRTKPNIHFFSGPQSDAHWTPKDSSDGNRMSIELDVGPVDSFGFAGFELNRVEGTAAPEREPYFYHKEDRESPASGGSPRLVILFTGVGNRIELRPDEWTTSWQRVGEGDGDGNWDSNGGICGFRFDVTYEEALACHPEAVIQAVFMVTDSNWMPDKATGYINWIDQLQYNNFVYSHASDNNNSPSS